MGPSALSSVVAPWTKVPAAMMTGSLYPGISQGSLTYEHGKLALLEVAQAVLKQGEAGEK